MKNLTNRLIVIRLYIRHLLTLTSLEVKGIQVLREINAGKTRTRILWRVHGCHRIAISGYRDQPGNIQGVTIREGEQPQVLTFRFHGYNGVKELSIEVPATDIQFFKQFNSRVETQNTPLFPEIKPVVFFSQPEIQGFQTKIILHPVTFNLETQALLPGQNR